MEHPPQRQAAVQGWFHILMAAIDQRNDMDLNMMKQRCPAEFKKEVMTLRKSYSGLQLTAMQRAALIGNSAAGMLSGSVAVSLGCPCRLLADCTLTRGTVAVSVGLQLSGGPERRTVSLSGVKSSAWRSELPIDFPDFLSDILGLCKELTWLQLAVLSGDPDTVRKVDQATEATAETVVAGFPSPALLSLFAQPTLMDQAGEELNDHVLVVLQPINPSIPYTLLEDTVTPEFIKEAWSLVRPGLRTRLVLPSSLSAWVYMP